MEWLILYLILQPAFEKAKNGRDTCEYFSPFIFFKKELANSWQQIMWGHKKFTAKLGNLSLLCVTFGKSLNHFAYFCPVNYKIEDNKTLVFFFIDQ